MGAKTGIGALSSGKEQCQCLLQTMNLKITKYKGGD